MLGMTRAMLLLGAVAGTAVASANVQQHSRPAPGPAGSWRLIGQTHARHTADHDSIIVHGPYDNFRRIKFRVRDAPLKLVRMVVTYDNGAPDQIPTRYNIPQGGESRVIDLRGAGKRSLRRVDYWYDTRGWTRGTADVTLYGMK
jgi:hypothetical protein